MLFVANPEVPEAQKALAALKRHVSEACAALLCLLLLSIFWVTATSPIYKGIAVLLVYILAFAAIFTVGKLAFDFLDFLENRKLGIVCRIKIATRLDFREVVRVTGVQLSREERCGLLFSFQTAKDIASGYAAIKWITVFVREYGQQDGDGKRP